MSTLAMSKMIRWGCAVVALGLVLPMTAQARRGYNSSFVMTPSGPVPRSVMYGAYMTPQQWQASRKAEIAEYGRYLQRTNPTAYKEYQKQLKEQSKNDGSSTSTGASTSTGS